MAPKRQPLADEPPPPAVSSDEEAVSSEAIGSEEDEDEEGDESFDSDQPPKMQASVQPKPHAAPPTPSKSLKESSSSETESESDSDTDSDVRPTASRPLESTPTKSSILKRPSEVGDDDAAETSSKKPKNASAAARPTANPSGEESSKKPLFQRLWSIEDEIVLLQGMIEFKELKGMDPSTNVKPLLEFVRDKIQAEVTPAQLSNKIRTCKKKFRNNLGRGKNGEDRVPSKPLEQKTFELSKILWSGTDTPLPNGTSYKRKKSSAAIVMAIPRLKPELVMSSPKKDEEVKVKVESTVTDASSSSSVRRMSQYSNGSLDADFVNGGLQLADPSKRMELEQKWKRLRLAELRLVSERAALVHEEAELLIDAYESALY